MYKKYGRTFNCPALTLKSHLGNYLRPVELLSEFELLVLLLLDTEELLLLLLFDDELDLTVELLLLVLEEL